MCQREGARWQLCWAHQVEALLFEAEMCCANGHRVLLNVKRGGQPNVLTRHSKAQEKKNAFFGNGSAATTLIKKPPPTPGHDGLGVWEECGESELCCDVLCCAVLGCKSA